MRRIGLWGIALLLFSTTSAQAAKNPRTDEQWQAHDQLVDRLGCQKLLTREFPAPKFYDRSIPKARVELHPPSMYFALKKLIDAIRPWNSFFIGWAGPGEGKNNFQQLVSVQKIQPKTEAEALYATLFAHSRRVKYSLVAAIRGILHDESESDPLMSDFITQHSRTSILAGEMELQDFLKKHEKEVSDFKHIQFWFLHSNANPFSRDQIAHLLEAYALVVKPSLPPGREFRMDAQVVSPYGEQEIVYSTIISGPPVTPKEITSIGPEVQQLFEKIKKAP